MRNQVAIRWARTPWLAALLVVTFFARALVPTGFMPGPGGLILCPGYAPAAMGSAAHQMPHGMSGMDMTGSAMPGHAGIPIRGDHPLDRENMGFCPFAAAASTMSALQAVAVLVFAPLIPGSIALPPQERITRDTIVPTRLPRGPPFNT